ncbi:MAG TPA: hypothetical protein VJ882_03580, partial [Desulfuromonadales bacterium]|nr:hypothetical protein [Desulfuromonadales bacterium]
TLEFVKNGYIIWASCSVSTKERILPCNRPKGTPLHFVVRDAVTAITTGKVAQVNALFTVSVPLKTG